ncbi:Ring-type e3 ubiquitin transferase [Thalictrum thalictroides]|uniref:RING-type E3 ubiquitin transferase n=1 Tax=Thalictrum thalictroides TaxID=46969 RepID=A0A7J6WEB3_THATH|nr:Ring-type e3 ubiquitin transferase [Thalictrum thalictroides]
MEEAKEIVNHLFEIVREISVYPECRNMSKRLYSNLVRRVKLLSPLFEELKDSEGVVGEEQLPALVSMVVALDSAKEILQSVNQGSKLYQALQEEDIAKKFQEVTEQIDKALTEISYRKLHISEEVQEQTELVHTQFRRAKERMDSPDSQLHMDLAMVLKDKESNITVLKRISEKLQLQTINDIKKESLALHELAISNEGDIGDCLEDMSSLLKKLKNSALSDRLYADTSEREDSFMNHRSPVIPDDFRCPISLELMKDPVIVSTGQTYERSCIRKWLDAGHKTCPKTQQTLLHTALTPNYVLKSLIIQWCESNGVELPRKQGNCRNKKSSSNVSDCDQAAIATLLQILMNGNSEEQRAATGELRLLAKRNSDNRVCIAEAGAIPLLVGLLSSPDPRTQEHAVTALLNLSIHEPNKGNIVNAGAIPDIVEVLKNGSMEARENAAATLFSLSVIDENKVAIGAAGAIPALINLLCQGSARGKKDAATAIFNLSFYQGNKVRAVRAGIVAPLMRLLMDSGGGMVDEALAILAIIASHQEGKVVIGQAEPIPVLIEVMKTGSPRNRENAASVLWSLCAGHVQHIQIAKELGAEETLKELLEHGTDRAKRKARNLLDLAERTDGAIEIS